MEIPLGLQGLPMKCEMLPLLCLISRTGRIERDMHFEPEVCCSPYTPMPTTLDIRAAIPTTEMLCASHDTLLVISIEVH